MLMDLCSRHCRVESSRDVTVEGAGELAQYPNNACCHMDFITVIARFGSEISPRRLRQQDVVGQQRDAVLGKPG
jgi:hypothetical protein